MRRTGNFHRGANALMRTKVTLIKSFGMKASTEYPCNTDSNRVMMEDKAMVQDM